MSNPNDVTIYSPEGEPFEMSRVNARDLTTHRGWTYNPPSGVVAPAPAPAPVPAEKDTTDATVEGSVEDAEAETEAAEADEAEAAEEDAEAEVTEGLFTTEEEFEGYDRDAVVDYLAENFPAFKPHHKAGRDSLVAKAIELAAG